MDPSEKLNDIAVRLDGVNSDLARVARLIDTYRLERRAPTRDEIEDAVMSLIIAQRRVTTVIDLVNDTAGQVF